jgi:hypothetical protein
MFMPFNAIPHLPRISSASRSRFPSKEEEKNTSVIEGENHEHVDHPY